MTNQKSLDKNKTKNFFDYPLSVKKKIINSAAKNVTKMQLESLKPKELVDYASKLSLYGKITEQHAKDINEILNDMFTQQRTELLEEIKTRVYTFGGFEDDGGNLCHYDSEILEWVNDLLNKKDEYNK